MDTDCQMISRNNKVHPLFELVCSFVLNNGNSSKKSSHSSSSSSINNDDDDKDDNDADNDKTTKTATTIMIAIDNLTKFVNGLIKMEK